MSLDNYVIPFAKPEISEEEIQSALTCLQSGWLTTGMVSFEYERRFGECVNAGYAVAVSSCTAALHLSLIVSGISPGDEVITSPLTFVSTVNVIEYLGAVPVFVDISPKTFNIDPDKIEEAITKKTKAIITVHYAGHPCDMEKINQIAKRHNLMVIEDAAHALGAKYKGKCIGDSDNLVCFSFYATKNITTAEGGMITTNNEKHIESLKKLRLHGLSKDAWKRYTNTGNWEYDVDILGYKYNMPDLLASLGIEQLKKMSDFQKRRSIAIERYNKNLISINQYIQQQDICDNIEHAHFMKPILLNEKIDRNKVIAYLKDHNIQTSVLFKPVYRFTYYLDKYRFDINKFETCEKVFKGLVCLPLYPSIRPDDIDRVCMCLEMYIKEYAV